MAFAVEDFRDLLRLLEEHPEWRAELRQYVLTEDLLGLPAAVRQLAEAQARTESQLAVLTARVDALAAAQARTEQRVSELASAQTGTAHQLATLTDRVETLAAQLGTLVSRVGDLTGEVLELRYARRAHAYFNRLARRLRVVDSSKLADLLDDAVDQGRLSETERAGVLDADLVLTGRRRDDRVEVYFVVEVSAGIGVHDVERALERAAILAKLDRPAMPVVAGRWIDPDAQVFAQRSGVWQVLNGRASRGGQG